MDSSGDDASAAMSKRRRLSLCFDDPVDRTAEALRNGRRVVALEPLDATAVGTSLDALVDGPAGGRRELVRFRQAGFRAALVKALFKFVDLHARTGGTLLDMKRTDAPGRVERPAAARPTGPEWMWRGTARETAREQPYEWVPSEGFEPCERDERDHRVALEALATVWCGWLKTVSGLERMAAADEAVTLARAGASAAAVLDTHAQLAEILLTRHLIELAWCAVGLAICGDSDRGLVMANTALLWLGQCVDAQDESGAQFASPAAACELGLARRGLL